MTPLGRRNPKTPPAAIPRRWAPFYSSSKFKSYLHMGISEWIKNICQSESPDNSIIAYNFGLFKSEKGYVIYLIGSKAFDEEDQDWACNMDFEPNEKYLLLPDEFQNQEWKEILNKVERQLKEITKAPTFNATFLSNAKAITTGFDDGDMIRIK